MREFIVVRFRAMHETPERPRQHGKEGTSKFGRGTSEKGGVPGAVLLRDAMTASDSKMDQDCSN